MRTAAAGIIAALALVALVGCAAPGSPDASTSPAPASAEPEQQASAEPTPSSPDGDDDGIDTSGWLTYATHDGDVTYRYPADWTLESDSTLFSPDAGRDDVDDPWERWMDSSALTAPNGQQLLRSGDFIDIGGACPVESRTPIEVLAIEPAPLAASPDVTDSGETVLATLAVGLDDGRWVFGMGITTTDALPADGQGCGVYLVSGSSDGGFSIGTHFTVGAYEELDELWTIDALDDATAYMQTTEYATLAEILRSVRAS